MPTKPLTREMLEPYFDYDPDTGHFTFKPREGQPDFNAKYAGKRVTCKDGGGYINLRFRARGARKRALAHRAAWAMVYGECPTNRHMDHINGNRADNRLNNLRLVNDLDNSRNRKVKGGKNLGVYQQSTGRWAASIGYQRKMWYLGVYATREEAAAARRGAETILGFHERHGMPIDEHELL